MLVKIASKLTLILHRNNIISEDETEIYQYGLEMILSTILNCMIVLLLGALMNEPLAAVIFFIIFALVRSSSGGYHADTYLKCNSIFAVNLIMVLLWVKFAAPFYFIVCHVIFILIYFMMVTKYAPIENPNKTLSDLQKKHNKVLSIIYGIILTAISLILWYGFDLKKYAMLIAATMLSITISMAIVILRKENETHEEYNS